MNIAIVPARSGSKGLKDKNIKLLNGKPLVWYSINAALQSGLFEIVMVSTDSQEYAKIAIECGAEVPFLRSEDTSGDDAGSWDVVREVLNEYHKMGKDFETVCLLQPTSPLRTKEDIIRGYTMFVEKKADAVTAVCEVDHSPLWSMVLPEDCSLTDFRRNMKVVPRQLLDKYYRINGALYIRKIDYDDAAIVLEDKEYAFIMERERSVDIDVELDFKLAEIYMEANGDEGGGDYD